MFALWFLALALVAGLGLAAPIEAPRGLIHSDYAPVAAACPSGSLLREANGLSDAEAAFVKSRKPTADKALASWLSTIDKTFDTTKLPTLGLATSGGGHRSFLTGAGVVQAFDSREGNSSMGGLYQSLTYHSGLSGGGWLVSALAANSYQTVSSLTKSLWTKMLDDGLFTAGFSITNPTYLKIARDLIAKKGAGYGIRINDVWGRLLSDQFLVGDDGAVSSHFSGIADSDAFKSFGYPYPILTTLGVDTDSGECMPADNAIQYEITPYEFGSWDSNINAFTQTKYLGTKLDGGKVNTTDDQACVTGYDNVGYVLGTSSNLFNAVCDATVYLPPLPKIFDDIIKYVEGGLSAGIEYATYHNPFYNSPIQGTHPAVANTTDLSLVDGGEKSQNNPIWPFIQPSRSVDVLIVNDNSGDKDNLPDGSSLFHTHERAQAVGLTKMPVIADTDYITKLNGRPAFFGCNSTDTLTIIYIPNHNYTFNSAQGTFKLEWSAEESAGMIGNGGAVATVNGDQEWPTCMACGIMTKSGTKLPDACTKCLSTYCYN